jgi:hypothetical protein
MCSSNILKILSGAMTLLFSFCNKNWKTVYHFYFWHANMQMCVKLCLAVMNRETRNWQQTLHQMSTNSLTSFMDQKGVQYT